MISTPKILKIKCFKFYHFFDFEITYVLKNAIYVPTCVIQKSYEAV